MKLVVVIINFLLLEKLIASDPGVALSLEDEFDDFELDDFTSGPEEIVFDKPGELDRLIQETVKEEFKRAEGGDVWPALNSRADREALQRQAAKDSARRDGLKAALLPGGSELGVLAVEGGHKATSPGGSGLDGLNDLWDEKPKDDTDTNEDRGDPQGELHFVSQVADEEEEEEEKSAALQIVQQQVALVGQHIATGAVAQSGAFDNLPRDYTGEDDSRPVPYMMTAWFLATERQEMNALNAPQPHFPTQEDEEFLEWFISNGGETQGVEAGVTSSSAASTRGLIATQDLEDGEEVVRVPLRLCITAQTAHSIRTRGGFLSGILKDVWKESEEWGLALILLYEHFQDVHRDGNSRFAPFIRTLRTYELGRTVMRELQGTYAADLKRQWEEEAEDSYRWVSQKILSMHPNVWMRNPNRMQAGTYTREDWRWALGVVRRRAVTLTRRASNLRFLALVPYVDFVGHSQASLGGNITLSLDNHVRVVVGPHATGAQIHVSRGNFTDSETLFKFHQVSEEENPFNSLAINLPGAGGHQGNIVKKVEMIRKWREEMQLPPRAADLWRAASTLQLYGSEEEAEMGMLPGARQLGWPGEEPVELPPEVTAVQLYSANLFETPEGDSPHVLASFAAKSLAKAAVQLQTAVAVEALQEHNSTDPAIQAGINATRNFFFYGIQPSKGLDDLDQLLIRKMELMDRCGDPKNFKVWKGWVSGALLCGARLVLANTSDIMLFYANMKEGPSTILSVIPEEDGGFNHTLPISRDNEVATLQALEDSLNSLLGWYPTSMEEDESLLTLTTLGLRVRAAVLLRLREKQLLHSALHFLTHMRDNLQNMTAKDFQVEMMEERRLEAIRKEEEHQQYLKDKEEVRRKFHAPEVVANITVNMGGHEPELVEVKEGEDLERIVQEFAAKFRILAEDTNTLRTELRKRVRKEATLMWAQSTIMADGSRQVVVVKEGEVVEDKVKEFVALWDLDVDYRMKMQIAITERIESRAGRRKLVSLPISVPDGRSLVFNMHEGEQHEPASLVQDFLAAWKLPDTMGQQLLDAVLGRLPQVKAMVPIALSQERVVNVRVCMGDDLQTLAAGFVEVYKVPEPEKAIPKVVRVITQHLYPGALNF